MRKEIEKIQGGIKGVIFDIDGTLINSDRAMVKLFNKCLELQGLGRVDARRILKHCGNTSENWFRKLQPGLSDDVILKLARKSEELYEREYLPKFARAFPEAKRVVEGIMAKNSKVCLVTNQTRKEAQVVKKLVGYDFQCIIAADDVKRPKPDAEALNAAVRKLGLKKNEVVYVGDTEIDLKAGKNAGIRTIILENKRNKSLNAEKIKRLDEIEDLM